jgi:hypothetical protein
VLRKEKNHRVGIRRHEQQVGDKHHLKVFANEDAADTWLQENDPEGVAFEYFWSEPDRAAGLSSIGHLLNFEIVDPLTRAQLRNQPARLFATTGPSL